MIMPSNGSSVRACGSMQFFLLQAVAIHGEDIVISAGRRMGLSLDLKSPWGRKASKVVGCVYVWQWFTWCFPICVDPLVRFGMVENGVQVTIIQDLCKFFGKGCHFST